MAKDILSGIDSWEEDRLGWDVDDVNEDGGLMI